MKTWILERWSPLDPDSIWVRRLQHAHQVTRQSLTTKIPRLPMWRDIFHPEAEVHWTSKYWSLNGLSETRKCDYWWRHYMSDGYHFQSQYHFQQDRHIKNHAHPFSEHCPGSLISSLLIAILPSPIATLSWSTSCSTAVLPSTSWSFLSRESLMLDLGLLQDPRGLIS